MKKKFALILGTLLAACTLTPIFAGCSGDQKPVHEHKIYPVEAVDYDCEHDGHAAYDECIYCRQKFINGEEVSDESVIIHKSHNFKEVNVAAATCYSAQVTTKHYICKGCGLILPTPTASEDEALTLEDVYSGARTAHSFNASGICINANCSAKIVDRKIVDGEETSVNENGEVITNKVLATPGSWHAYKSAGGLTLSAGGDGLNLHLSSNKTADRYLRLCNVPTDENGGEYVGVYGLSFDLKVTTFLDTDPTKTLKFGFTLRSGAGTTIGDTFVIAPSVTKKVELNTVYHFDIFVETIAVGQLLQIEIANIPNNNKKSDKDVEIRNIKYTYYSDEAKTYNNRLETMLPDSLRDYVAE